MGFIFWDCMQFTVDFSDYKPKGNHIILYLLSCVNQIITHDIITNRSHCYALVLRY